MGRSCSDMGGVSDRRITAAVTDRIDGWRNGSTASRFIERVPRLRPSANSESHAVKKHPKAVLRLENVFAFIEGHPNSCWLLNRAPARRCLNAKDEPLAVGIGCAATRYRRDSCRGAPPVSVAASLSRRLLSSWRSVRRAGVPAPGRRGRTFRAATADSYHPDRARARQRQNQRPA